MLKSSINSQLKRKIRFQSKQDKAIRKFIQHCMVNWLHQKHI